MDDDADVEAPAPPPKPAKRGIASMLLVALLAAGLASAGVLVAPRIMAKRAEKPAEPVEAPIGVVVAFQPIVVDVRGKTEEMHHLKVVLSFELADGTNAEEFEKYGSRGREAAILYLRGLSFDIVTDPARFESLSKELGDKVVEAMGKKRVRRVMITDFVTQ